MAFLLPLFFSVDINTIDFHRIDVGKYLPKFCQRYNQLPKYSRHCTVFWHKWPVHDLVPVIPPSPLIKVVSNTRPYSKLGGSTLNGREEGGQYYISQTCDQQRFEARKIVFERVSQQFCSWL